MTSCLFVLRKNKATTSLGLQILPLYVTSGKELGRGGDERAGDRRKKQDGCHRAPQGHCTSSSALSKHHDLLWVLNVVLFCFLRARMIPAMYLILESLSSGFQVFDPLGLVMLDPLMIHTMALMSFMDETTFPYPTG